MTTLLLIIFSHNFQITHETHKNHWILQYLRNTTNNLKMIFHI